MSDFLQHLLTLVHPDRLLRDQAATGVGVRVAVIDSGIDRALIAEKHSRASMIEGAVFLPHNKEPLPYNGTASAPHGTTVADIILSIASEVTLYSADVFGPAGGSEAETVIRAIYHCLDAWNCQIVNLSLGIIEARLQPISRRNQFLRAIEEAYHRGVLIVAAAHNDHPLTRSFPAAFAPPLVSVDKGLFDDPMEVRYRPRDQVEFQAHGRGDFGPFAKEPATSWAAPHVTGVAARLLSLCPELRPFEVKALLSLMSRARGES